MSKGKEVSCFAYSLRELSTPEWKRSNFEAERLSETKLEINLSCAMVVGFGLRNINGAIPELIGRSCNELQSNLIMINHYVVFYHKKIQNHNLRHNIPDWN
jgi:hypothetical protein